MLLLFCYFFFGNHCCLSKSTPKDDAVEMAGMESATSTIHLDKDLEEATRDEKISLLSDMTNNVKDEEKGAYHTEPKDDTVDLASMAKERKLTAKLYWLGLASTTTSTHPTKDLEKATKEETTHLLSGKSKGANDKTLKEVKNGESQDKEKETQKTAATLPKPLGASEMSEDFNDNVVDSNSALTKYEVNQKIMNVKQKGVLDKDTFISDMMSFFPSYNSETNKNKLEKLFDRLDESTGSRTGFITSRQYMLVTTAFSNMTMNDKLTKIFKLIDENGDEELTFEEFEDVVKDIFVLKEERKLSKTTLRGMFSENTFRDMGMNFEGKIKLTAFVDACTKHHFIIINYIENFRGSFVVG